MSLYNWTDGELVTAEKLNAYGAGMEQIKADAEAAKNTAEQKAGDAAQSANSAAKSEANAANSAGTAQSAAESASGSEANAANSAAAAQNAQAAAEAARDQAQIIAGGEFVTFEDIANLQDKQTVESAVMNSDGWENNQYSFETTHPSTSCDIEIALACTATQEQIDAFNSAMMLSNADANIIVASGAVPTVDIPIILKVVPK